MKKLIMVVIALLYSFISVNMVFADGDTWTQKASLGKTRSLAASFSIGEKGYIGTGYASSESKDFWEYDPTTNVWTQKADFGGAARYGAVGLSIGDKGYIGLGRVGGSTVNFTDFWEYNPVNNIWTQKANFGAAGRICAVGFSIGDKGYVGTGFLRNNSSAKDFWEYDPTTNYWIQKADFGGGPRAHAVGFSIGSKGYIGTGGKLSSGWVYYKDFWEYEPDTNTWTQKADFGGTARIEASGFSMGSMGYVGVGGQFPVNGTAATYVPAAYYKDFWEYNPVADTWTKKADFGGTARTNAVGFSIGSKGYIGTGGQSGSYKDFWEYEPSEIWAVLIEKDLLAAGDGLITRDTKSGLDWLDVSLTVNQNYDDVRTGNWYKMGFRHATREEVEELFIHAGTPDDNMDPAVTYPIETLRLMNLLGTTGGSRTYGLCGTDYLGNLITLETHPIGVRFSALLGKLDYLSYGSTLLGEAHFSGGHPFSNERSSIYGSFLVRDSADTTPDQFIFNYETDVDLNTLVTSNTIKVSGIDAAAPITIEGGTYSINGGSYTSADGKVNNGDTVTVQQTSSGNYLTTTDATLTIGGVSDTFSVTTKVESIITLNPVANITTLWPPNNKMVAVRIQANASDSAGEPVKLTASVSCNESAKQGRDWTQPVVNQKTGLISLSLLATRAGNGPGRIYTITITATGTGGNSVTKKITITVPHDQSNNKVQK